MHSKLTRRQTNAISKLYYTPNLPTSFASAQKLTTAIRKTDKTVRPTAVKGWLENQKSYILHKQVHHRFTRSKIHVPTLQHMAEADLTDMNNLAKYNSKMKYLLCVIDAFSRKAYVTPLPNKQAPTVAKAMDAILKIHPTKLLRVDRGSEFVSSDFKKLMAKYKIKQYFANEPIKAGIVERFNKTIKGKIARYLTANNTYKYLDVLPQLVHSYNTTHHSTIKLAPNQVNKKNAPRVYQTIYGETQAKKILLKYKVGDEIYLKKQKTLFSRGFKPTFKPPTHTIIKVIPHYPPRYLVSGKQKSFYEQELIKAPSKQ